MSNETRVPAGVPTGGQFAASAKGEASGVTLSAAGAPVLPPNTQVPATEVREGHQVIVGDDVYTVSSVGKSSNSRTGVDDVLLQTDKGTLFFAPDEPAHRVVPGMPVGETTPVEEISEGDYFVLSGRLYEVGAIGDEDGDYDEDGDEVDPDSVTFETYCGDHGEEYLTFGPGETVQKVGDDARYLYEEDAKVMFPDRVFGDEFDKTYGIIETPDRSQNWEEIPDGTPEERVWSQVEGFADDGRYDYQLVPGYDSSALNYVITERPWADADHARTFDSN